LPHFVFPPSNVPPEFWRDSKMGFQTNFLSKKPAASENVIKTNIVCILQRYPKENQVTNIAFQKKVYRDPVSLHQ
jgi:hypothetical protein